VGAGLSAGEDWRRVGLDGEELHVRVLLLEVLARAGDRAARADACDERGNFAVCALPDLGTGGAVVEVGVRGVLELLEDHRAGRRVAKFARLGDRALHAGRAGRQDDFRTVCGRELAALDRHRLGHGEDEVISLHRAHEREAHAGVAARRLDDRRAGLERAVLLRRLDHREKRTGTVPAKPY